MPQKNELTFKSFLHSGNDKRKHDNLAFFCIAVVLLLIAAGMVIFNNFILMNDKKFECQKQTDICVYSQKRHIDDTYTQIFAFNISDLKNIEQISYTRLRSKKGGTEKEFNQNTAYNSKQFELVHYYKILMHFSHRPALEYPLPDVNNSNLQQKEFDSFNAYLADNTKKQFLREYKHAENKLLLYSMFSISLTIFASLGIDYLNARRKSMIIDLSKTSGQSLPDENTDSRSSSQTDYADYCFFRLKLAFFIIFGALVTYLIISY